jgi:hypothetical protein
VPAPPDTDHFTGGPPRVTAMAEVDGTTGLGFPQPASLPIDQGPQSLPDSYQGGAMSLPTCILTSLLMATAGVAAPGAEPPKDLKRDGAFGFPQARAMVLCDEPDLRISAWNDASYLYVQAILWRDDQDAIGETADGRPNGDQGVLSLDVDADGKVTPHRDRLYYLNPWPSLPGLRYQVCLSEHSYTGLQGDSKGRGAIRYLDAGEGHRVRIDSFVIPLGEIGKRPGEAIRLAYYGDSPHPAMTVNSVGYRHRGRYYPFQLPRETFHSLTLSDRPPALDVARVPEGRDDPCPLPTKESKPLPALGTRPPEISAKGWLNTDLAPRLEGLRGEVVLVILREKPEIKRFRPGRQRNDGGRKPARSGQNSWTTCRIIAKSCG